MKKNDTDQIIERAPKKKPKAKKSKQKQAQLSAMDTAKEMLGDTELFDRSGPHRTATMTWAHIANADATDRQTEAIERQNALLEVIAKQLRANHQLSIYATPDAAFPEGVKDQMKKNAGIKVIGPDAAASEDAEN